MKDIQDLDDVKILVNTFYGKVQQDELIGPVFNEIIQNRWPEHLEKMYRFWETVLLDNHSYYGSPFAPHAKMPLEKHHIERWLQLFNETLRENFSGETADEALWRAEKMAQMFQYKIDYIRENNLS